ncbi:MAG: winged helix-turn-helix transcriptional regulator [Methanobacteriota archaeon]|nr:MAG: winged helix-turn-helix transcriptional regulator [Euryarchaeota archaeon]
MVSKKTEMSLESVLREMDVPQQVTRGIEEAGGPRSLESKIPRSSRVKAMAQYHKTLSDEIRLRLLFALAVTEMCPCVMKAVSGTTDSKLSYHLKLLESEGLIVAKRVKNWRIYSITDAGRMSISTHER